MPWWWLQEAPCTLDVAITILDCLQLLCWLTCMQVISSNQCSQAAALCTHALVSLKSSFLWASYFSLDSQLLTMAIGLKLPTSNDHEAKCWMSMHIAWLIGVVDRAFHLVECTCMHCPLSGVCGSVLFLGFHLGCCRICYTDRTFKLKSSLHWAGWSWLDA